MNNSLGTLDGTLYYRERLALPPDAVATVELAFLPGGAEEAQIIALDSFTTEGRQVPLPFELVYDAGELDGRRNYFLRARIDHALARFRFASYEPVYVITRDHPTSDINIMLHQEAVNAYTAEVNGTVLHGEHAAPAPDSVLITRLEDISRQDVPAHVLGEQIYETAGRQFPLPFRIAYDPAEIDERFTYRVSARIEDGSGILRYISDTIYPVITRGSPSTGVTVWVRAI